MLDLAVRTKHNNTANVYLSSEPELLVLSSLTTRMMPKRIVVPTMALR